MTGDGVHARRSDDLVPALTPEALWTGKPLVQRGCSILALGTGVGATPAGVLDRGTGAGAPFRQGPGGYVGPKIRLLTFVKLAAKGQPCQGWVVGSNLIAFALYNSRWKPSTGMRQIFVWSRILRGA